MAQASQDYFTTHYRKRLYELVERCKKDDPMRTMQAIRGAVGRDAIFTGDASISATRGANACLPVYEPRSYLPPVWGGLGFAFPAAMGAKVVMPSRPMAIP